MPVYEFFCPSCNMIFNFLSKSINTQKVPKCPRDPKHKLQRKMSLFAAVSGNKAKDAGGGEGGEAGPEGDDPLANMGLDEARMEKAAEALAGEAENMNDDDPRQAAKLMRKFSDMTGLPLKGKFQEALARMESGEDPEALEREMGDSLEDENPFEMDGKKGGSGTTRRAAPPGRDETLYEM
jgi:putative FmdB family regulatory protein